MLRDHLVVILKTRFPERAFTFPAQGDAVAIASAPCRELDRVEIFVEGDEVTVHFPEATHGHFSPRDSVLTREQREEEVISAVVSFLDALFSDRVVVFQGGWQILRADETVPAHPLLRRRCLWSRFLDPHKA